jgi:hypothetical protein
MCIRAQRTVKKLWDSTLTAVPMKIQFSVVLRHLVWKSFTDVYEGRAESIISVGRANYTRLLKSFTLRS